MSAKVGHADLGENQVENQVEDAVKQEADSSEVKKDITKAFISKETRKKAFKISKKVGKGALKLVDKVDESGLAEQAGCMAAIPGGEILCCICKLFIGARKAHKQMKKLKKGKADAEGAAEGIEDAANAVGNAAEIIGGD